MPKIKLTDAAAQRLTAPKGERVDYFDATLPGFALRVSGPTPRSPAGRKNFVLFYRHAGAQKRLTLEPVYPALPLADARKRAGEALALLDTGADPAAAKAAQRAEAQRPADTIGAVVSEFVRRHLEGKGRAPRYIQETQRNFDNHVLPRWRDRDIKSITRRDVIDLLDAIVDNGSEVKGAGGTRRHIPGGPIAANRVLAAIRALFNWALRRGIIEATPAALVERPGQETQRERALSRDEIAFAWPHFVAAGYPFGHFFRLALITGQRREEVAAMQWDEIDFDAGVWTIPATRTKAGRAHAVPLSALALDVLAEAREACEALARQRHGNRSGAPKLGQFVLSTNYDKPISGYSRAKSLLDAAIAKAKKAKSGKALERWTIHDLRRTVATQLAGLGVDRFVISRVLNHADRGVTAIYDRHDYLDEKSVAMAKWGDALRVIVTGKSAKVVNLRTRRHG